MTYIVVDICTLNRIVYIYKSLFSLTVVRLEYCTVIFLKCSELVFFFFFGNDLLNVLI